MKTMIALLALFPVLAAAQETAGGPAVVPVYEEPRHRLVWEKGDVHIFNTTIPAGDMSAWHEHKNPSIYVVMQSALMRNQDLGGEWMEPDRSRVVPSGTVLYFDYGNKPQAHRVENVDDHSFQVIGVVNAGKGTEDKSKAGTTEFENSWFATHRYKIVGGKDSGEHVHAWPVFLVQVSKGASAVIQGGQTTAEKTVPGTFSVHPAKVAHTLQNAGGAGVELVEIEMK